MTKNKALENYTKALGEVADFKAENEELFSQYDSLLVELKEAEEALKIEVRDNVKGNLSNEFIKVTYSPAFKKGYDLVTVLSMITPKLKEKLIQIGAIKQEVNKEVFDQCVEDGIVDNEVKQKAFVEIEQTARVIIKESK